MEHLLVVTSDWHTLQPDTVNSIALTQAWLSCGTDWL